MDKDVRLEVVFYRTSRETEPVRDWLKRLSREDKKRIGEDLKTIQYGWPLGMPAVRKLDPRLWEVRVNLSQRIARILFTIKGHKMVLLHGFIKKTPKTPKPDLGLARERTQNLEI